MAILDTLNNREKAIVIWLLIFLLWMLSRNDTRSRLQKVIKVLLGRKLFVALTSMILYLTLIVFLYSKTELWRSTLLLDTIFWGAGTALVLFVNVNQEAKDGSYFKSLFYDTLKLTVVIEFVINLYAFSLWLEFVLIPLTMFLIAIKIVVDSNKEHEILRKPISFILSTYAILMLFFTFRSMGSDDQLLSPDNVSSFILPILLTVAYIPFLYFWALIMVYEILFIKVDHLLQNKPLARFMKRKMLLRFNVSLRKVHNFHNCHSKALVRLKTREEVIHLLKNLEAEAYN